MRRISFQFLLVILALVFGASAFATPETDYALAKECYNKLTPKNTTSEWLNCIDLFGIVSANDPDSNVADKATYSVARIRSELYKKDRRKEDLLESFEFYNRVVSRYPKSSLSDDSLFMIGNLRHIYLNEDEKARQALETLIKRYPKGDKARDARVLLSKIKGGEAEAEIKAKISVGDEDDAADAVSIVDDEPKEAKPSSIPSAALATPMNPAKVTGFEKRTNGDDDFTFVINLDRPTLYKALFTPAGIRVRKNGRLNLRLFNTKISTKVEKKGAPKHARLKSFKVDSGFVTGTLAIDFDVGERTAYKVTSNGKEILVNFSVSKNPFKPEWNPTKAAPATVGLAAALPKPLKIVIDPGHGGKDPGAISKNGLEEKKVTLDIARRLAKSLKKNLGAKVWLTRDSDKNLTLEQRNEIVVKKGADLFLSVHVNASTNPELSGIETYYLNNTTDKASQKLAERENKGAGRPLNEVQHILSTMLQNYNADESRLLAKGIHEGLLKDISSQYDDVKDLKVKSALFYVLVGSKCPSALLELSFISNPEEEKRLLDEKYRNSLVFGVTKGIKSYLSSGSR